jgi:hypothetical protein
MTPFEQQLKQALARQQPSADFTQRVLSQLSPPKKQPNPWLSWRLATAAAAACLVVGGAAYQQHERHLQGEAAKQKLLLALRITGSKLHQAEQRVNQIENSEVSQ